MRLNVKPSSPAFCTGDPAARVCCFGGQRSPENYTSAAAEVERETEQLHSKSGTSGGVGGERSPSHWQGSCSGPDLQTSDIWFFPGWLGSWSWSCWWPGASRAVRRCLAVRRWGRADWPGSEPPWWSPAWTASCSWSLCWTSSRRVGPPPEHQLSRGSSQTSRQEEAPPLHTSEFRDDCFPTALESMFQRLMTP